MTITDEILIVANQIANKGTKPTVALIKNKLSTRVPLPVIISTLKSWQHDPSFIALAEEAEEKHSSAKSTNSSLTTDYSNQDLYQEMAAMKKEIVELQQLVKQLIDQHSG